MTMVTILREEAGEADRRAASLERLAGRLEREAVLLEGSLDDVVPLFTDAVWRGPAASRSRDALLAARGRLRHAADETRAVAALFRRRADEARERSAELRGHIDEVLGPRPT